MFSVYGIRPIGSIRPMTVTVATLWVTLLCAANVAALRADDPPAKPIVREIFVPFEDLNILLEGQTQRIFLTRQEYEELLAKAKTSPVELAPRNLAMLSADYVGQVEDGRVAIAGMIVIDVLADGLHALPLELAGVGVRSAALDGKPAAVGINDQRQPVLFLDGKGRKSLKLELVAPLETSAALQSLNFQLPVPAATRLKLTVPGNVELKSGGDVASRVLDQDANVTKFELLPKRGPNTLVMTLNNRQLLKERVIVARSVLVDEVTQAYERLHATVSLGILHGAADRFRLNVPAGFEVTDVRTPLLARWVVEKAEADGKLVLDVTLREPATDTVVLNLSAIRAQASMEQWTMPRLEPLDVAGHVAVIGLLVEDRLKLDALAPSDLIPINTQVLAQAMPESVFLEVPGEPKIRTVAAYYAPQAGYELQARFSQPPSKLSVTTNVLLTLADAQQLARGAFALLPEREKRFSIEFTAPAGWHVTQVTAADGSALPFEIFAAEKQSSRILVKLPAGIAPGVQTNIFFQAAATPDGWLGEWSQSNVAFPQFAVIGADKDEGAIAVAATDDLTVRPDKLEQLVPLDEAEKPKYGLAGVPTNLVYRYEGQSYAASLVVERAPPTISARTFSFLRVDAESLAAHYEIVFDVQDARTQRLFLLLPAATPTALSIRGLDGVVVKEFNSEPADEKPAKDEKIRRWSVLLADRARDRIRLAVDFQQPMAEKDWQKFGLPIVRADGVAYQSGAVAVEGSAELDIEVAADPAAAGNPRSIDVGELAAADYQVGRRLLGAWGFVGETPEVTIDVARRPGYGLPSAIVQRAELITLVATSGLSQTAARFQLRTKANYLEVRLPADAKLWSVYLDGQPVAPQRDGDAVLLSLPAGRADTLRDLQIVYETPVTTFALRGTLTAPAPKLFLRDETTGPRAEVPVAALKWHLRLPSGYKIASSDGTVFPDLSDPHTRQQLAMRESPWRRLSDETSAVMGDVFAARHRNWNVAMAPKSKALVLENYYDVTPHSMMPPSAAETPDVSANSQFGISDPNRVLSEIDEQVRSARATNESMPDGGLGARAGGMAGVPRRPAAPAPADERPSEALPTAEPPTKRAEDAEKLANSRVAKTNKLNDALRDKVDRHSQHDNFETPATPGIRGLAAPSGPGGGGGGFGVRGDAASMGIAAGEDVNGNLLVDDSKSIKAKVFWALEGVRSLPFDFKPHMAAGSDVVTFQSLGVEPLLQTTLIHQPRLRAVAWTVALGVLLAGAMLIGRGFRNKFRFLVVVLLAATVLPLIAPWMHEVGTIADFAFWAAIALVPFYLVIGVICGLVSIARRVKNVRRTPRRPSSQGTEVTAGTQGTPAASAATAGVALLVWLVFLGGSSAVAQPAGEGLKITDGQIVIPILERLKPVAVPEDAVIIPYNPDVEDGWKKAEKLLVPYSKYVELWNLAFPDKRKQLAPLPAPFALAGAAYEATLIGDEYLLVTGKLEIELFSDDAVDVPLPLAGGVLAEAKVDGQAAKIRVVQIATPAANAPAKQQAAAPQPAAGPSLLALTVSGKGRKKLDVSVRLKLERRGGWRVAEGRLPTAAATALTLRVPDEKTEVRLAGVRDRGRYETAVKDQRIETALSPDEPFNLQWRPKVAEGEVDKSLTANSLAEFDIREDALRLTWRVALEFPRSRRESFTLTAPADYLIERVTGANVRGWQATPDGMRQKIEVTLLKTAADKEALVVYLSRRGRVGQDALQNFPLPAVFVADAVLHQGTVVVRRSPLLDVRLDAMTGLSRTDAPADMIDPQHSAAEQSLLGLQLFQAFRFPAASYAATLDVEPIPSTATAELQTLLRIADRERELETRIVFKPAGPPVFAMQVRVPIDLKLDEVTAPAPFEWSLADAEGAKVVSIFLAAGQRQPFAVLLRGKLGEPKAADDVPLPVIDVRGVKSQEGDVVVQVDPAVDVRAEELRGVENVLLSRVFPWLAAEQRGSARLALHHRSADYAGVLKLSLRQPKVSCFTVTNIKLTGRTIEETIALNFTITDAGVREISFTVPEWLRAARVKSQLLRRKRVSEPDAAGMVKITLELQDEVIGPFQVLVENDRLLTREKQRVPVPGAIQVQPKAEVRVDQRLVALESSGRDEVVFDEQQGVEALTRQQKQWQKLTELFGNNLLAGYAVQPNAAAPLLAYHLKDRAAVTTVGARIGLADTVLEMDGSGAFRGKQTYQVDNSIEQFLVVELPENATLWTAKVAGEPVKPTEVPGGTSSRRLRIPLVKTAPGDLDYPVVLIYGGKLSSSPGTWSNIKFPLIRTININVELSHVSLRLPNTHRWLNFGGTMGQVDDRGEFQAGMLDYQTKKVQQLSQLLSNESTDELSKLRAGNNLKQLGQTMSQSIDGQSLPSPQSGNGSVKYFAPSNANVTRNLNLFNESLQEAQKQVAGEEKKLRDQSESSAAEFDNRFRLNAQLEQQQTGRAKNVVTKLGKNFDAAQPQGGGQQAGEVNPAWFEQNKLQSEAAPAKQPGKSSGRFQAGFDPMLTPADQAVAGKPMAQQQELKAAELSQGQFKGSKEQIIGKSSDRPEMFGDALSNTRNKKRSNDESREVQERYQQRLQSQNAAQTMNAPAQQSGTGPTKADFSGLVDLIQKVAPAKGDSKFSSNLSIEVQQSQVVESQDGSVMFTSGHLASLDVDLPERGTEYLFKTPRGEIEITAHAIDDSLTQRAIRLAIVAAVVIVLLVVSRLASAILLRRRAT